MRRVILLLTALAATLVVASGVAWAVIKVGTDGPDTLRGTNGDDTLIGKGGNDYLFALAGRDNLLGGPGKDNVLGGNTRGPEGGDKNVAGGPGNDVVIPGLGSDNALGGGGNDFLVEEVFREASVDTYSGGPGNDVVLANNRPVPREDIVTCGGGFDRVLADREDTVAPDCERVHFGLSDEEFFETIPPSFLEGLPPSPPDW